jgi:hypothetical protein
MYVDSIALLSSQTLSVKGWITHTTKQISAFILGDQTYEARFINRADVKRVYPNIASADVGFDFLIDVNDIYKPFSVVVDGESLYVGTLERWYIKYSGFKNLHSSLTVVENFYADPDRIRNFAINNLRFETSGYHRGQRSERFILDGTKEKFEKILGRTVINWNHPGYANGSFQFCTKDDPIVYHVDTQQFAAIVFLSPDAPLRSGTSSFKSTVTGARRFEQTSGPEFQATFKSKKGEGLDFYDNSTLEYVDSVANVYNRLVLFDGKAIHAASGYFGDSIENGRFFQLFFFDVA